MCIMVERQRRSSWREFLIGLSIGNTVLCPPEVLVAAQLWMKIQSNYSQQLRVLFTVPAKLRLWLPALSTGCGVGPKRRQLCFTLLLFAASICYGVI